MANHLISFIIFLPLLGVFFQALVPGPKSRWTALASSLAASACAFILILSMKAQSSDLQALESLPWIGSYAISYEMAIDGLNSILVLLIAILFPVLIAAEWNQKLGARGMHSLFLILQASLFGAVCAQDLFLQFFFWALSALPFYFLVGIWGGKGREKAALGSIMTASLGNALIFAALVIIYYSVDPHSFSLRELSGAKLSEKVLNFMGYSVSVSDLAFSLMGIGLSFRAPIWPLHGWFIEMAEEAPYSVLVALAAGTVPVALYIFVRVSYLLFPTVLMEAGSVIVGVGLINLMIGGVCAIAQKGLRGLLAYICLSELGLVLMGIGSLSAAGLVGAVYQHLMLGLGLAGFGLFSSVIAERTGQSHFLSPEGKTLIGGIAIRAPAVSVVAGVIIASLLGFPGTGGFVGHALVIIGSYSIHPLTIVISVGSLLLASYYLFTMYRSIFLGQPEASVGSFQDLTLRERLYMAPVVLSLLVFGLYPKPLIDLIRPTVLTLLSTVK